jgi:hypothetical protein
MSVSNGPFTFYFGHGWGHPRYCGWWGPPMYRPPYYRPPHHRPPGQKPPGGGEKPTHLPANVGRPSTLPNDKSLYDRRPDGAAKDRRRPSTGDAKASRLPGQPSTKPNNVYTDREGNIYRRDDKGWQQRQDNQWTKPSGGGTPSRPAGSIQQPTKRPSGSVKQPSQRPTHKPSSSQSWNSRQQSLERDRSSRNRGNQRTQQYHQKQQRSSRTSPRQAPRPAPSRGGRVKR